MSLFNKFFGSDSSIEMPKFWQKIESYEDLQNALEKSNEKWVVIFKHSTRCIISKTVLKNFEKEIENAVENQNVEFYYLDLLNYREISNTIAEDLHVTHQSPQAILVKNKEQIFNASHDRISFESIKKQMN